MKNKLRIIISFIFVFSISLMFFACKKDNNNTPLVLETPYAVGLVNNGDLLYEDTIAEGMQQEYINNRYLIVVNQNKSASAYRFFWTDNEDYTNEEVYVSQDSEKNYLDITEYFDSKKEYHYFAQYLGTKDGKFLNSEYSKIMTYTPASEKIGATSLQIVDGELRWISIMQATSYEIYEEVLDKNDNVVTTQRKIATVNPEISSYDISGIATDPYKKYNYSIKAITTKNYYISSDMSNKETYIKNIILNTPSNLNVTNDGTNYTLSWDSVEYATEYKIIYNDSYFVEDLTSTSYDITDILGTRYSNFSFKVIATNSDVLSFNLGEESQSKSYDHTLKLSNPQNLLAQRNGIYIDISWTSVSFVNNNENYIAPNYTIVVEYDEGTIKEYHTTNNSQRIEISDLFTTLESDKDIVIKVKADSVTEYILESDFESYNMTILA
ncbi:MAG: hypothetical protein ACI4T1_04860 [Christensenellales bacterium]